MPTMRPIRLKTGRMIEFHWSEPDQGFLADDHGTQGLTDAEYRQFCQIIESRRPVEG